MSSKGKNVLKLSSSASKMAAGSKRKYWQYKRQQYASKQLSANRVMSSTTNIVYIKRTLTGIDYLMSLQNSGYGVKFSIQDLPDYSALNAVYDQYKILSVRCDFHRTDNITGYSGAAGAYVYVMNPTIVTATTEDNILAGPTFSTVSEFTTARVQVLKPGDVHSRTFRPKPTGAVVGGTGTAFAGQFDGWLDMQQGDVPHYGLNMAWEQRAAPPIGLPPILRLYITLFVAFKRTR